MPTITSSGPNYLSPTTPPSRGDDGDRVVALPRYDDGELLPSYDEISATKLLRAERFNIFDYGLTNHFWRICSTSDRKRPVLKYFAVTNHEQATLSGGVEDVTLASVKRRTIKGEGTRYVIDYHHVPGTFRSYYNVLVHLDPVPTLECTSLDGELIKFQWQVCPNTSPPLAKRFVLHRLDLPPPHHAPLAHFTFSRLTPFKVGQVKFAAPMGDQEAGLLLLFLTLVLYDAKVPLTKKPTTTTATATPIESLRPRSMIV